MKIFLIYSSVVISLLAGCCQSDKAAVNKNQEKPIIWKSISILDFGGINDGIFDNSEVITNAIAKLSKNGGVLNFPKGHYIITKPILLRDNIVLEGVGKSSIIENISKDNILSTVIFPGIHHPAKNEDYRYLKTESQIKKNTDFITLLSLEHDIKVGEVLFIHSENYKIGKGARGMKSGKDALKTKNATKIRSYKIPDYLIGNRVTDVKGKVITFENTFKETILAPMVTKGLGVPTTKGYITYSCQNAVVRKLRLKTKGKAFRFGLAYKCTFEDLIINAESTIFGNAFQYCHFKNIESTFSNRFIELKNGTHDTKIENCNAKFVADKLLEGKDKYGNVISIGENAFNIEISGCNINAGEYNLNSTYIHLNSNYCKISDNKFIFSGNTIKSFLIIPSRECIGNSFVRNEVKALGQFNFFVRIGTPNCINTLAIPSDNYIGQNRFLGKPLRNAVSVSCGVNNMFEENFFEEGNFKVNGDNKLKNNTFKN
jgi:hypothetical protein